MAAPPRAVIPSLDELPLAIETPRLRLRPQIEDDASALFRYTSDPEVSRYVSWASHADIAQTRAWLRERLADRARGKRMLWTIEHAGEPVGAVSLREITWAVRATRVDRADLGFWIARPLWGKGLVTEAAGAATRWAFDTLGLHKLTASCYDENTASRRVIEKLGFGLLCRIEDDIWRDGRWYTRLFFERAR